MAGTGASIFGPTGVPPQDGGAQGAGAGHGTGQGLRGAIRFPDPGPLAARSVSGGPREAPFDVL